MAKKLDGKNELEVLSENFVPPECFKYIDDLYKYTGLTNGRIYTYRLVMDEFDTVGISSASFSKFEILEAMRKLSKTKNNPIKHRKRKQE